MKNPKFYVFVFFTFVFDFIVVVYEDRNLVRCWLEGVVSVISIVWMIFLYPYYLEYDRGDSKEDGDE